MSSTSLSELDNLHRRRSGRGGLAFRNSALGSSTVGGLIRYCLKAPSDAERLLGMTVAGSDHF